MATRDNGTLHIDNSRVSCAYGIAIGGLAAASGNQLTCDLAGPLALNKNESRQGNQRKSAESEPTVQMLRDLPLQFLHLGS